MVPGTVSLSYHTGDTLHSKMDSSGDSVNYHNPDKTAVADMLTKMGNCEERDLPAAMALTDKSSQIMTQTSFLVCSMIAAVSTALANVISSNFIRRTVETIFSSHNPAIKLSFNLCDHSSSPKRHSSARCLSLATKSATLSSGCQTRTVIIVVACPV